MLTKRYLLSSKNIPPILQKIIEGTAPPNFSYEHLAGLGFKSSNDRAIIPLLKELGFLSSDGAPTDRYHQYRDASRSKQVLGEALHETYGDLFHIREHPTENDKKALQGKFKSTHNVSNKVAELQTATFYALLKMADLEKSAKPKTKMESADDNPPTPPIVPSTKGHPLHLRYNIEIHLPPTKDVEVYNAIFKSLKLHLGE